MDRKRISDALDKHLDTTVAVAASPSTSSGSAGARGDHNRLAMPSSVPKGRCSEVLHQGQLRDVSREVAGYLGGLAQSTGRPDTGDITPMLISYIVEVKYQVPTGRQRMV